MVKSTGFSSVSIFGAGAWGTALAALVARDDGRTLIWTRNANVCTDINERHENRTYLPGITLPKALRATTNLDEAMAREAYIVCVPAQHNRALYADFAQSDVDGRSVAIASKGIERDSLMLMHEVLRDTWPAAKPAIISGPSFAHDVARGKPTAITLADAERLIGNKWLATLGTRNFRPYLNQDLVGVALGGSVKNVLAIAAGIVRGMGMGESAHAALISRGYAEFQRLGIAMGAIPVTMTGLSGLGDLILTAGSERSRNMSLGCMLGEGKTLADILAARNSVSEGVASAEGVCGLALRHGVEMPVSNAVADIVADRRTVKDAIDQLMSRPLKIET